MVFNPEDMSFWIQRHKWAMESNSQNESANSSSSKTYEHNFKKNIPKALLWTTHKTYEYNF